MKELFLLTFLLTSSICRAQANEPWSIVIVPDTQLYTNTSITPNVIGPNNPGQCCDAAAIDSLNEMLGWIAGEVSGANQYNIKLVLGLGDIVHNNLADEWSSKYASFSQLNNIVPYILSTGNHDYADGNPTTRNTLLNNYFSLGQNTLNTSPQGIFTTEKDTGKLENTYSTFLAPDGRKLLIFNLEFGPRQEVVDWANSIASKDEYRDYTAILLTHSYLENYPPHDINGAAQRNNWSGIYPVEDVSKNGNPHYWAYPRIQNSTLGEVHDGEELWNELVKVNSNFEIVLNGHHTYTWGEDSLGSAYLESTRNNAPDVHQMFFNAQFTENAQGEFTGGDGYIRLLTFLPDRKTVEVRTYSPIKGQPGVGVWRTDPSNEFPFEISEVPSVSDEEIESLMSELTDFMLKD